MFFFLVYISNMMFSGIWFVVFGLSTPYERFLSSNWILMVRFYIATPTSGIVLIRLFLVCLMISVSNFFQFMRFRDSVGGGHSMQCERLYL